MINYIAKKHLRINRVKELLSISEKINHFTNNGPIKSLLENTLENILNIDSSKKILCLTNGTAALHCLMLLAKKRNINKWVIPSFTFPSAVTSFFDVDILDIDKKTSTLPLDEEKLQKYEGIILTSLFGSFLNITEWENFCKKNNKILILDNASSPLSCFNGKNICSFGNYSFGSLHHTKYLGVGEGGFVVVPKEDYDDILAISNFGFNDKREYNSLSSNFKMSDFSAAHILAHIEKYDIKKHISIQSEIIEKTKCIQSIEYLNYHNETVYGNLPIVFNQKNKADNTHFQSMNIIANKYYKPLKNFPNTSKLYDKIINIPLYDTMNKNDIKTIINSIKIYSEMK